MSDDLIKWLRSSIEHRKATAEKATTGPWTIDQPAPELGAAIIGKGQSLAVSTGYDGEEGVLDRVDAEHIALNDPQDTIARCEAELEVLELTGVSDGAQVTLREVLRIIAHGYRHFPGWKEAWHTQNSDPT